MRYDFVLAVTVETTFIWDVSPCSLVSMSWRNLIHLLWSESLEFSRFLRKLRTYLPGYMVPYPRKQSSIQHVPKMTLTRPLHLRSRKHTPLRTLWNLIPVTNSSCLLYSHRTQVLKHSNYVKNLYCRSHWQQKEQNTTVSWHTECADVSGVNGAALIMASSTCSMELLSSYWHERLFSAIFFH
jgi:hypothetical protein